jgi:parallel beta-helix repeat protein
VQIAGAFTNVPGGAIGVNTTWDLAGSPYIIQGNVSVSAGFTLTVDAGVQVKFDGLYSLTMNGNLAANGTVGSHVTFTTNNGVPAAGQWRNLIFNTGTSSNLTYSDVRYGGYSNSNMIELNGGYVTISNCAFTNSQNYGIAMQGGSANISGSIISSCNWAFYQNTYTGTITFGAGNNFTGNTRSGVYNSSSVNFTGNDTLPNPGVPYYMASSLQVQAGATFTIAQGCILKFQNGGYLHVYGTLLAVGGTAAIDNIYFTDYRDDVWGGDTNGDGIATGPAVNWWYGINFFSGSSGLSRVDNCKIRYTGYGAGLSLGQYGGCINIFNCGPKIKRNFMSTSYFGIRLEGVVTGAEVDSNDFGIATQTPVALSFEAFPSFQNNTFSASDNGYDAIGILPGTLSANAILPQRNVTAIPNVTYVMLGSVTVPAGISLTINPGIVIKWVTNYTYQLDVLGTLIADGNAAPGGSIVFTSVKDDNWGNPTDTNNDGSTTVPAQGDWGRIWFEDSSNDAACILDYCKINYGSGQYYYYSYRANVQTSFASPTITHCDFANCYRAITLFGNSDPDLRFNTYTNTTYEPVELSVAANPTFGSETMTNVGYRALGILPEVLPGNGILEVKDFAGYVNIVYILSDVLNIPAGAIMTIEPTIVIKGTSYYSAIEVDGTLIADAAAGTEIVFTSVKDDIFGNPLDTNGDGNSTVPARNNWDRIQFDNTSVDAACVLDYCIIKWGNEGVDCESSGPLINHCTISDNTYGIRVAGNGNPRIWNTALNNSQYTPILMSMASDPDFQNLTFNGNAYNGLGILEGTLAGVGRLKRRDVAGITSIAYVSLSSVIIAANGDLTIDPGVVIKMLNYSIYWDVNGIIRARGQGLPDSSITWTSIADDSRGGDTNNNGNATSPAINDWYCIELLETAVDSANRFEYCNFYYGNGYGSSYFYGALKFVNAGGLVDHCDFGFHYHAIGVFGNSNPTISNSVFTNITYAPIIMDLLSNPSLSTGNSMFNVGYAALGLRTQTMTIDATWPQRDFAGYTNITYVLEGDFTVASGATLNIPAGTVIKGWYTGIYVNGALQVDGVNGNRVVMTSVRDDGFGNPMDTNQDGNTTLPSYTNWYGLQYNDISVDATSRVNYAQINYADAGINWVTAAAPCSETIFQGNQWGLYIAGASNPTITNFDITGSQYAPIAMSLASNPTFVGGSLSNNGYQAIEILGETTSADYTIPRRDVAGDVNIVYLLRGQSLTVGSNSVLTIQPGVVIKLYSAWIYVNKGLMAVSSSSVADSQIVFTSYRDDFYGGDTNNDGDASVPATNDWVGIQFNDVAIDPSCHLKNCVVRYGYNSASYGLIMTTNASPTIENTLLADANTGVRATGASNPVINNCDLVRLTGYGVNNVSGSFTINAENNWWGSNTGPTHAGNPGGTGVVVTNFVDYTPYQTGNSANPVMGDVSLNSTVTAYDAALILLWIVNPVANPLNALQQQVADVSAVGGVTSFDASLILQYVAGLINIFPAETTSEDPPQRPINNHELDAVTAVLTFGDVSTEVGLEVDLPLQIHAEGDVWSGFASLTLPLNCEFVSFTGTDGVSAVGAMTDGSLKIAYASAHPIPHDVPFAHLRVRVTKYPEADAICRIGCGGCKINEGGNGTLSGGNITTGALPQTYALLQNYPNPFNPSTVIPYELAATSDVQIVIYDVLGRKVTELVNTNLSAGRHSAQWNGKADSGIDVASGVYLVRMKANSFEAVRKIQLMK